VSEIDIWECHRCGGRMRILCTVNPPETIRRILDCLGLPSSPQPIFLAVQENHLDQGDFPLSGMPVFFLNSAQSIVKSRPEIRRE
jgi:hypothetical protein